MTKEKVADVIFGCLAVAFLILVFILAIGTAIMLYQTIIALGGVV